MTEKPIPEIMYSELKKPICPTCKDPLTMDDPGCWYCENCDSQYSEYNNITECRGECGRETLVLSSDFNFNKPEDRYCQVKGEHGETCLGIAQAESDQLEYEDLQMREHIKGCTDENCDCRNY